MITNTIFKRIAVLFRISAVSIFMIVSGMIVFSPYGQKNDHKYKLIKESVIINASVEKVFQYLGNSNNASDWSRVRVLCLLVLIRSSTSAGSRSLH